MPRPVKAARPGSALTRFTTPRPNAYHIENRLHYVRDFTYDNDRCRVYVRDLPRNFACETNTGILIIRCQPGFRHVPEANRLVAAALEPDWNDRLCVLKETCREREERTSAGEEKFSTGRSRRIRELARDFERV